MKQKLCTPETFIGRSEREGSDRYLSRSNTNLNSVNSQGHLANNERVFTKNIVCTEVLNH